MVMKCLYYMFPRALFHAQYDDSLKIIINRFFLIKITYSLLQRLKSSRYRRWSSDIWVLLKAKLEHGYLCPFSTNSNDSHYCLLSYVSTCKFILFNIFVPIYNNLSGQIMSISTYRIHSVMMFTCSQPLE